MRGHTSMHEESVQAKRVANAPKVTKRTIAFCTIFTVRLPSQIERITQHLGHLNLHKKMRFTTENGIYLICN